MNFSDTLREGLELLRDIRDLLKDLRDRADFDQVEHKYEATRERVLGRPIPWPK